LSASGNGRLLTSTSGGGQAGDITVNAKDIQLTDSNSGLFAQTTSTASAGNLTLQPLDKGQTLTVNFQEGAQISASTSGSGKGGTLTITAPSSITISGDGTLGATADASSTGQAGDVLFTTQQLTVANGAKVSASTNSTNPSATGGNLTVQASQLHLTGGSSLSAGTTGAAQGGNLTIEPLGNGQTLSVNFQGGATASASTSGSGQGGTLTVTAPESITLSGDGSLISAETTGSGAGGNLTLKTGTLTVQDGAQVRAGTSGEGNGGNLTVNASDSVQVLGAGSGLFVNATTGSTAGNLEVTTGQITVSDGAQVTVSSPSGQAGNLTIQANSVHLNRGTLRAETGKSSSEGGANITLNGLDLLRLDNESLISASAFDQANGGNITIDSTFIVATPPTGSLGSDITANAVEGNGGRVNITTQGQFGIQLRPQLTPKNDITVSSQFGLTGEFQLNSPDVDPSRGLINLPTAPVDTEVSQVCQTGATQNQNSFIITGRGGLPPNPRQMLRSRAVEVDWVTLDASANNPTEAVQNRETQRRVSGEQNSQTANNVNTRPHEIVEAQGWVIDDNGKIALVAMAPTATPHSSWQKPVECRTEESPK
jgi:large exoprotein involved in heme utilization and adhesion